MIGAVFEVIKEIPAYMAAKYPSTKDRRLPWCVLAVSLLGFIPTVVWAQTYDACAPAPVVKAVLDQLPHYMSPLQTDWQYREQQRSAIRPILQQYPNDVFVLWASWDTSGAGTKAERDKLVEELKSRHEKNPDDPLSSYLYGYVLDTATGSVLPDQIDRCFYSYASWDPDGKSFFYFRMNKLRADAPPAMRFKKIRAYWHKLGADGYSRNAIDALELARILMGKGTAPV